MSVWYSDVVLSPLGGSQTCVLPLWRVRAELALPLAVSRVHHRRFARVRPRGCAVGIPWEVLHVGGLTGHVHMMVCMPVAPVGNNVLAVGLL